MGTEMGMDITKRRTTMKRFVTILAAIAAIAVIMILSACEGQLPPPLPPFRCSVDQNGLHCK